MQASSLAIVSAPPPTLAELDTMRQYAAVLIDSGFLPQSIKKPEQAIAIMVAGRSLQLDYWVALNNINVINGKTAVSPQLMNAMIYRSGLVEDIQITSDDKQCIVTMKRKGKSAFTESFTIQDAAALGLTGKDNYKKQPKVMLRWRAFAACARIAFPDIILGLYTPEEMGAEVEVTDDGAMTVIVSNGQASPAQLPAGEPEPQDEPPSVSRGGDSGAWTEDEARQFAAEWKKDGWKDADILAALGVSRLGEWAGTRAQADARLNAHLDAQLRAKAAAS